MNSKTAMADKELMSPPPKAVSSVATFPTLEQKIYNMMTRVLKKDYIASFVGAAVVESWDEDWSIFESEISFDDAQGVSFLSRLHSKLREISLTRWEDEAFENFYFMEFLRIIDRIAKVHEDRLKVVTTNYFCAHFQVANISFSPKDNGRHFGCTAHIKFEGEPKRIVKYYVKTHSAGRVLSGSSAPKAFDPKELMVYKILERLDVGCETHFLHRSLQDVYIATLDASHGGSFKEFSAAVGDSYKMGDEEYGRTLWGDLNYISGDPICIDREQIEKCIQGDGIANNFVIQIVTLDMLSHILRLNDLLNNTGNFGFFFESETSLPKLKVIDFRINNDNLLIFPLHFSEFWKGNGCAGYSHRILRYVLHARRVKERIQSAIHVLTVGPLLRLLDCIEQAFTDVEAYVNSTELFADKESLCGSLTGYRDAILQNYSYFIDRLKTWAPEY